MTRKLLDIKQRHWENQRDDKLKFLAADDCR